MSPRREVPTVHWQAIVAHNLVVLQQGEDVAFVRQYSCWSDSTVAGLTARRDNVLSSCQWASLFASPLGFGQSVELVVKSGAGEVLSLT